MPVILLVDDDGPVRACVGDLLRLVGFRVVDVASAEAALASVAESGPPDLVLSDVCMPGLNGIQLASRLRRQYASLPIVLMSGYTPWEVPPDLPFLNKPFPLEELLAVIQTLGGLL